MTKEVTTGFPKIPIGVSACLLGEQVRFDGGHKHDPYLTETLAPYFEYVPMTLFRHFIYLYQIPYLMQQHYLYPHPSELKLRNHA